ncbi:MAG TPA: aminotransferase class III-fold pyridoxal phosphate-dependent enzyme, partial [Vicinamibacterales bacterium]|nr:aminotransferase class III-fold pyridoxal phosphate-dependent enzyme [Vicinamibacterales bacterium]
AAAYAMLDKPDPIGAAAAIVRGYHQVSPLAEGEIAVLFDLIRARLAISVAMAARQGEAAPGNEYLQISQQQVWRLIEKLDAVPPAWAHYAFRHACGLEPCPSAPAVRAWIESNRGAFHPVVLPEPRAGNAVRVDLSVGSPDLRRFDTAMSPAAFTAHVARLLTDSGAQVGVGSRGEARLVYVTELFHHAHNWIDENRTVHLGIDLFGAEDTPVFAPLPGVVHSLRMNDASGDYGPTVVLQHDVAEGVRFYTLYGHLCARCLDTLHEGDRVKAGDAIGCFGGVDENGGWAPHLHFQVIVDLLDRHGDFPGVAAPSERPIWFSLCPDPNLILGIPPDLLAPAPPDPQAILDARRRRLGPNVGVSYRKPLTILRGHRQYLFDADGRRFLDAVNNVPHVGHSHPRVVEAAARQLAVLTTNSRYLHPLLAAYIDRLTALLPPPLEVCYIVNSGSEANELALRLARAATGQRGIVVVEGAYHGNTTSLIDISPYKFDGPGGGGCPPHVRTARMPDSYRNLGRGFSPGDAAQELAASPYGLSAFFCESLLSCGGQIVLPDGYLAAAYAAVRKAGGICVADEVQVGFGRVGTHFWGFETQGVVPDVVTMGKPIGNGFPLAAVVTTRVIARAFDTGMEYFNTFGGSPVACAVGLAVLDVMRDEGLQPHALDVGSHLHALLSDLRRFPIVGDVRGLGLFLGVELVRDRETLEPAAAQADYVVNRMRERGILVSTDGPLHNVIKIKPPMPFDRSNAERLAATLAEILEEDAAQP